MEGTIGEIRLFASNFAPRMWAYCAGQAVSIRQNTALFAIVGGTYGGDGQTTFALPDFRGRAALGAGQGNGLTEYALGEKTGSETETLTIASMPAHIHAASASAVPTGGAITLNAIAGNGSQPDPGGNFIGEDTANGLTSYASSGDMVNMDPASIQISNVNTTGGLPSVSVQSTGGGLAHNNVQPFLVLNYIICMVGIFPARN